MPIHDWTRTYPGLFHDFHRGWTVAICNRLNAELLPKHYSALLERRGAEIVPDVIVSATPPPPRVSTLDSQDYAARADRIAVHHPLGDMVAVIEIVSPGNKAGRAALRSFVEKAADFLRRGVHLSAVDLFPPTPRDPGGIHKAIWDEFEEEPFDLPPGQPLTLVGYNAGRPITAYIQPVGFGESLPNLPLYLNLNGYVLVPLESTYQATWDACPEALREAVLRGDAAAG